MIKKSVFILFCLFCFGSLSFNLNAQTPEQQFIDQLNLFSGNKVLLIGTWSGQERTAWNNLLNEEGIFEFDIKIIDESEYASELMDSSAFEKWLRDKYAAKDSRWLMMDGVNQAVAYGKNILGAEEFAAQIAKAGLVSPVKQLRTFLREHPDHLEAHADLMKQLRRRAVKLTAEKIKDAKQSQNTGNTGTKNVLDPETDLIIWASFAQEVDSTFKGNWPGIVIPFFNVVEESQMEQYSPTMKAVFARHIAKVEAALQEIPTSEPLWNVWAWMARSMENRDWKKFLKSLDPFTFPGGLSCPAPSVAVWLTREAKANGDWEQVVELAKAGMEFTRQPFEYTSIWSPTGMMINGSGGKAVEGYPFTSSYLPMMEGLLHLGRLEEANTVFDDVIFFDGEGLRNTMVALAQSIGNSNLAQSWRMRMPDNSVPRFKRVSNLGSPLIVCYNVGDTSIYPSTSPLLRKLRYVRIRAEEAKGTFGWSESEKRFALLDKNNRLVVQSEGDWSEQTVETFLSALQKLGYRTKEELAHEFLRSHPSDPYALYVLACDAESLARDKTRNFISESSKTLSYELDYEIWGECTKYWTAFYENELSLKTLISPSSNIVNFSVIEDVAASSNLMKTLAEKFLLKIEKTIEQQPMSEHLWQTWFNWRGIGGNTRPLASLLESLYPSPMVPPDLFPLGRVMAVYYDECVAQERWGEIARLCRQAWERDLAWIDSQFKKTGKTDLESRPYWYGGMLLIEALLQDGKPNEADDVVEAWVSRGGKFTEGAELIELARSLKYDALADKWEKMSKN